MNAPLYDYWNRTLKGERVGCQEVKPECGFYRYRAGKNDPWKPLAIFYKGGEIFVVSNTERLRLNEEDSLRAWLSAARFPIDEPRYRTWVETGADPQETPTIGHNNPPADTNDFAKDTIAEALALAAKGITTEAQADDASRFKRTLDDTRKKVYADMRAAKKPHEDAAASASAPFNETIAAIDGAKEKIVEALTIHLKAQQKALDEKNLKEMEAAKIGAGMSLTPPQRVATAGKNVLVEGKKKATTLRKFKHFTVTDRKAALTYLASMATPPGDFDEELKSFARRLDAAGIAMPGIEMTEEERAV